MRPAPGSWPGRAHEPRHRSARARHPVSSAHLASVCKPVDLGCGIGDRAFGIGGRTAVARRPFTVPVCRSRPAQRGRTGIPAGFRDRRSPQAGRFQDTVEDCPICCRRKPARQRLPYRVERRGTRGAGELRGCREPVGAGWAGLLEQQAEHPVAAGEDCVGALGVRRGSRLGERGPVAGGAPVRRVQAQL